MKVNKIDNLSYKGALDGVVTNILRTCDTNEVVNAAGLDVGAMVIPRSYYDTKARNSYAGGETFFRELSGTFINCFSAGLFAQVVSTIANKHIMKDIKTKPQTWYSNDSLNTLNNIWDKINDTTKYINNILDNIEGRDGHKINKFRDINWDKVEWIDEKRWNSIKWKDTKYKNIQDKLKSRNAIEETLVEIINNKEIAEVDRKNILMITERRITNALQAQRDITLTSDKMKLSSNLEIILRDSTDMARDIFTNKEVNNEKAIKKIFKINKIKAGGAIAASCLLGLTNQYLNRKITEKRTGKKGFVGDVDYCNENRTEQKQGKTLIWKKIGASIGMAGMLVAVMRVKSFKDFAKKLEFTGPVSSGNAIKTVYGANIIGRFMAADNDTELRESMTRDYLGFLNWLVFGGFAAKGAANLMDKKGKQLFNYTKEGKGLKHWLNDMSLKTHNEIAAKGGEFAKKNIRKLNIAHTIGIAYSAFALGLGLPMLNKTVTEYKSRKKHIV